ncbi:MAG TPA: prepilin-type N-terminal cleavage/methylation domain-containing protein, partial [Pyrinomonadaceae bacterium]
MRRFSTSRNQSGVSYVELLVVIAIIAVVATLALMSFGSSREKLKLQNAANGLKIAFERARFDSVKRRPENLDTFSRVDISGSPTEGNQYTLRTFIDPNNPATPTDSAESTT